MEGGSVRWISKIKADFNGKKKHYPALVIIKKLSQVNGLELIIPQLFRAQMRRQNISKEHNYNYNIICTCPLSDPHIKITKRQTEYDCRRNWIWASILEKSNMKKSVSEFVSMRMCKSILSIEGLFFTQRIMQVLKGYRSIQLELRCITTSPTIKVQPTNKRNELFTHSVD